MNVRSQEPALNRFVQWLLEPHNYPVRFVPIEFPMTDDKMMLYIAVEPSLARRIAESPAPFSQLTAHDVAIEVYTAAQALNQRHVEHFYTASDALTMACRLVRPGGLQWVAVRRTMRREIATRRHYPDALVL